MMRTDIRYLTTKEVALRFKTCQETIARNARQGKLKGAIMIHQKLWLIPEEALKDLVINYRNTPKKNIKKEG